MPRDHEDLLGDIHQYIRDAYSGKMSSLELMTRGVALSARIQIALKGLDRGPLLDYPKETTLEATFEELKERIFRIFEARFVRKPDKPKWSYVGRDPEGRLHFRCSTGEERHIPSDVFWKTTKEAH